jgi:hypothetical protein
MKPAPIADFLDHIGRAASEKPSPRRETSPFRPRSLPSVQALEPRAAAARPEAGGTARPLWGRRPPPVEVAERDAATDEEIAARIESAHRDGREEGKALERAEAEERFAAKLAEAQERAATERLDFQLNEYARLEAALRDGLSEIETHVGDAVARILAPFLAKEAARYVVDELVKAIARLVAGGAPGLIAVRGPQKVLKRLRERIADLPVTVEFVEDDEVEATVECGAARIAAELKPWEDLLASLDG